MTWLAAATIFVAGTTTWKRPSTYAGLFPLLMLPQAFVGARARRRVVYALLLAAILLTMALPWLRYLFWLFQGDYYRTLSFYSIVAVILLSMKALSRYFEKGILNLWLLWATLIVLLVILYLPLSEMQILPEKFLQRLAAGLLITYTLILSLGRWTKKEPLCAWLVVLFSAAELAYFGSLTVNNAPTVTKEDLRARVGYNDYTVDAVRDIKASDQSFYRIAKLFSSSPAEHGNLNDAIVFDFYGTPSYNSFNNIDYTRFLTALEAMSPKTDELGTRWSFGSLGRPVLSSFLAEKYLISNEALPAQEIPNYEEVAIHENVHAYRNLAFLPLGLFFDKAISEKTFHQLSAPGKESALLRFVVLPDDSPQLAQTAPTELNDALDLIETKPLQGVVTARRESALRIDRFRQNQIDGTISCLTNGLLVFQMPFDEGWRANVDGTQIKPQRVDIGLVGMPLTHR